VHAYAGFMEAAPAGATLGWRRHPDGSLRAAAVAVPQTVTGGDTLARMAAASRMKDATPSERHALALAYGLVGETTNLVLVHQHEEADRPAGMPALRAVAHSLPAGWGGIGNASVCDPIRQPAVWRRENASTQIMAMQRSAVESYDVPAFLRASVHGAPPYLYRDSLHEFVENFGLDDNGNTTGEHLPASLDELSGVLPDEVIAELRLLVDAGSPEHEVLLAFVEALVRHWQTDGMAKRLLGAVRRLCGAGVRLKSELEQKVDDVVRHVYYIKRQGKYVNDIPAYLRKAAD
jgi:hypothetical protein